VAAKLLALEGEAAVDVRHVVTIVGADPALATEILFLANSSLFGFPARIQSLRHAVAVLGADCIRQLAMTVAIRALARGTSAHVRACWRHSMATAVIAEKIAPVFGCAPELAYAAGLLHDAGRLALLRAYPAQVGDILSGQYADAAETKAAEQAVLDSSHDEAGARLMEYWSLPFEFSEACAHHHDEIAEGDSELLRCVKTACPLANATEYVAVRYTSGARFDEILQAAPGAVAASLPTETELRVEVEARLQVFDYAKGPAPTAPPVPQFRRIS